MYKITGDQKYCDFAVTYAESCPNGYERNYGISCGVQAAEADIAAGRSPYVASDSYLESGDIIGSLAMTYDWCGSRMTAAQKTRWENYANQTIYNIWHPDQATWGGRSYPWSGWSINNPGNNYYYSFLEATMYWALASHDSTLLSFVRNQKLQPLIDYYAQIPGGGSLEGTGYGTSHMRLFELYQVWKDSTGEDIANMSSHLTDSIHLWMHETTPNRAYYAPVGDLARSSFPDLFDYHRRLILEARHLTLTSAAQDIAAWWLSHISVTQMSRRIDSQWDLLPAGSNSSVAPNEPLVYRALGIGRIFARTGWDTSALWMTFAAGKFNESHAHQDQGSFDLANNAWLAVTNNIYSASGINQTTDYHNMLRFVRNGAIIPQRENTESIMTVNQISANGDIDVTGNITPAYAGDASIQNWTRNMKFANRKLIVTDNFSIASGVSAVFQIDTPVLPVVSGNTITAGALNIRVNSPANPTIRIINQERYRIDISGGTTGYVVELSDQPITGSTPTQSPNPSPSIPPSVKFTLNSRVQVSSAPLNVRATANTGGTLLGVQTLGTLGTVVSGPTAQGGYNWWQVNFDSGVDGWAAEDFMGTYVAPVTPPSPPPTSPSPAPITTPASSPTPNPSPVTPPASGGGGSTPNPTPPSPAPASSGGGSGGGGTYIPPVSSGGGSSSGGSAPQPLFTHDLSLGTTDAEVKYLQQFLNTHGVPVALTGAGSAGNESTTFGPATKAALTTFQDKYIVNLPASERGTVGAVTRERFNTLLAAANGGSTAPSATSSVSTTTLHVVLTKNLYRGLKSAEVTKLQNFLISLEYLPQGNASGYYGPLTQKAVQSYQCASMKICTGTPASNGYGSVGPKTRANMKGS